MRTLVTAFTCLLSSVSAVAQTTHVFPNQASGVEGYTSVRDHTGGAPWWANPSQTPGDQYFRMQLVQDLPATLSGNIAAIAYRRDGAFLAGRATEQFFLEIEMSMSTSPSTASTLSSNFASNIGADAVRVIDRKTLAIGGKQFGGGFPETFDFSFALDRVFPYAPTQGSLCIDVKHYSNDMAHPLRPYPLYLEADAFTASKDSAKLRSGGRCANPNEYEPPIEFNAELFVDDSTGSPRLRYYGHRQYGQHHSRGFFMASLARISPGFPTPGGGCGTFEMNPTTIFLWSIEHSDQIYGRVRWPQANPMGPDPYLFDLPYDVTWAGAQWYAQELNYDVHTQEYRSANWVLTQVPYYLGSGVEIPQRVVWAEGPSSHAASSGTLGAMGLGPVIEYTTQ